MDQTSKAESSATERPEIQAQGAAPKEPEAIINKVARHFRLSNLIYLLGVVQIAGGAVLAIILFFVNLAGFRGFGYNYYYSMPRFSGIFSSLFMGLFVFIAFFMSGIMTMGFGKLVQAAEIYIQRRTRRQ